MALGKGPQRRWFNSVRFSSNPAPVVWSMIRNDFPSSRNRLLELVSFDWFDPANGWLSESGEALLESQFLGLQTERLGDDGKESARRYEGLLAAKVSPSDLRWLKTCVTAAELSGALRELAAVQAAVEELYRAYSDRYPGRRLLAAAADLRRRLLALAAGGMDGADPPTRQLLNALRDLRARPC